MSELDKMEAVKEKSQAIGEFLEWLGGEDIALCRYREKFGRYIPFALNIEELLAAFFEIDLIKAESEKRKLLADFVANRDGIVLDIPLS